MGKPYKSCCYGYSACPSAFEVAETRQPYGEIGEETKQHQSGRWLNDFVRVLYKKTAIVTLSDGLLGNGFGKVGTTVRDRMLYGLRLRIGARPKMFVVAVVPSSALCRAGGLSPNLRALRPGVAAKDQWRSTAYSVPWSVEGCTD
jgi:hypothetical protein